MQAEEGEDAFEADVVPFPARNEVKKGAQTTNGAARGTRGEVPAFRPWVYPNEPISLLLKVEGRELALDAKVDEPGRSMHPRSPSRRLQAGRGASDLETK